MTRIRTFAMCVAALSCGCYQSTGSNGDTPGADDTARDVPDFAAELPETRADADARRDVDVEAHADAIDDAARDADGDADDAGFCPETPCRLRPSCGCPAGQKCTVDVARLPTTLLKVCGPAGTAGITELCGSDAECMPGTMCTALYSEGGAGDAMCAHFCNGPGDCTGNGAVCIPLLDVGDFPGTCSRACDPLTNAGCPSGTACRILELSRTGELLTDCTADVGSGLPHAECTDAGGCRAGAFCADLNEDGLADGCARWCSYPAGAPPEGGVCPGGDVCRAFAGDPVVIGATAYGYCV